MVLSISIFLLACQMSFDPSRKYLLSRQWAFCSGVRAVCGVRGGSCFDTGPESVWKVLGSDSGCLYSQILFGFFTSVFITYRETYILFKDIDCS